jgi:ribulose-phosphate 3-epimerase
MKLENIYPSLICADQMRLDEELELLVDRGLTNIHFDVMDGQFVPRFGMYPEQMNTDKIVNFDVHIMAKTPELFIEATKDNAKVVSYTIHPEAVGEENVLRVRDLVLGYGKKFGIAINLSSDAERWVKFAKNKNNQVYQLCFMGIHPGVLIQTPNINQLIYNLNFLRTIHGEYPEIIQVDGGVRLDTITMLDAMSVNSFVAGTSTLYSKRKQNRYAPLALEEMLNV